MNPHIPRGGGPATPEGRALAGGLHPLLTRLRGAEIDELAGRVEAEITRQDVARGSPEGQRLETELLLDEGQRFMRLRRDAREALAGFQSSVQRAPDLATLKTLLEHHIRATRSGADLRRDLRATRRWLDADALSERMEARIEAYGAYLELLACLLLGRELPAPGVDLMRSLLDDERLPTRRAATRTLTTWAISTVSKHGPRAVQAEILNAIIKIAKDPAGDPISSRHALRIVEALLPQDQEDILLERLEPPPTSQVAEDEPTIGPHSPALPADSATRDDFLVRAQAVRIAHDIGGHTARRVYALARRDPSETVRYALADGLAGRGDLSSLVQLERLAQQDPAPSVRARASYHLENRRRASETPGNGTEEAQTPEHTFFTETIAAVSALQELADELSTLPAGRSRVVRLAPGTQPTTLAQALLPHVQHDHAFSLEPLRAGRVRVHRGERRVIRLWRLLWELRHPSSAKRQAGDFVTGTTMPGRIRVPSAGMAEVTPTGIPSQPVLSERWQSWGPWLPLPEQYLDSLAFRELTIVCTQGITSIMRPRGAFQRLKAFLLLSLRMPQIDSLRLVSLEARDTHDRRSFTRRMESLGFQTEFLSSGQTGAGGQEIPGFFSDHKQLRDPENDTEAPTDPGWGRHPLLAPLTSIIAARQNRPTELAIFCITLAVLFLGRLAWLLHRTRSSRRAIPLVIGGWGTRGKSGTERLKAAMFQGLGFQSLCKTTGCEATVLHAAPGGPATELFIYRPYERATIWEHTQELYHASRLGSPVFLWECMALRSQYVQQLQLMWTRDDISTVTNTYPDHEEIQGPSGRDVAESISSFLPARAMAITTESQMGPILRDMAHKRGTFLLEVSREQVDSLPRDLLARFPYQEHPANVALVAQMAKSLQLDPEEAIILMADQVVPDLGSLATYPRLRHLGRILEFSNGMSANERAGFLNNWRRTGFDSHDTWKDAATFHVTVVNNRRDRVPRSRIFADIIVNDAHAHRHILIGTNIEGLKNYIQDSLDKRIRQLDLFGAGLEQVSERLIRMRDQLCIVPPGALLRGTGQTLGIPASEVNALAAAMDQVLRVAPMEPLSMAEALASTGELEDVIRNVARQARGVFQSEHPRRVQLRSVYPVLQAPMFHDQEDLRQGIRDLAGHWMDLLAEALAFQALCNSCTGRRCSILDPRSGAESLPTQVTAIHEPDEVLFEAPERDFFDGPESSDPTADQELPPPPEGFHVDAASANRAARSLYREIFKRRIITLDDPGASGDRIIDLVARACPAGTLVRIMGMQNIKGTGLDFVYRWVHATEPMRNVPDLFHSDRANRAAAIARLHRWREWSIPSLQEALRALKAMPHDPETAAARSDTMESLYRQLAGHRHNLTASHRTPASLLTPRLLMQMLWHLLEPADSILRRRKADKIWADLVEQRISHPRAARELRAITQRQRGEPVDDDPGMIP